MFSCKFVAATREVSSYERPQPAPLMRRSFCVDEAVRAVRLTIGAPGFYELTLNGRRITRGHLAPYISNPDHYIYYDEYDLTRLVRPGRNVMGIVLGNGMQDCFCGHVWDFEKAAWRGSPRVAFALELEREEGTRTIEADSEVRVHASPIYFNDLRSGERYDARREIPGWDSPELDDSGWARAIAVEAPRGEPRLGGHAPVTIERELRPISVRRGHVSFAGTPRSDVRPQQVAQPDDERVQEGWLYDFGENNAGVCRLRIRGERGQKVVMQFGELLAPDGGLDMRTMQFMPTGFNQRDVYILKGDPEGEEFVPAFTYHGFRYCLVAGLSDAQATPQALTYLVMHGDFAQRGGFDCSDELANRLFAATQRSDLSNFYYFPTDCPHREKNGWTGDASVSAEQFMLTYSMEDSLREWLADVRRAQREDGALPGIVPTGGWGYDWGNGPAWDAALINLPFYIWKYRGDERVVRENAAAMLRYIDYIYTRRDERGLIHVGLGDWCQAGQQGAPLAPLELTDTLTVIDICRKAALMLRALHMDERAGYVERICNALWTAARRELIDADTLVARGACQTSQAMALSAGLFTEEERPRALRALVDIIRANDGLLKVGILGARVMFEVLAEGGEAALAYEVALTRRFPSFGCWMAEGETTLPESFKPRGAEQDSHNHHFFGSIVGFLMKCLCGINVNPRLRDPAEVLIAPRFVLKLSRAEGWYDTVAGQVSVVWQREGEGMRLSLEVPEGAYGRVRLSDGWHFEDGGSERGLTSGEYMLVCGSDDGGERA